MSGNSGFAKNIELIGYHDLNGKPGFQMAMQEVGGKYYLYVAHFKSSGWSILEVTDPASPRFVKFVPGPDLAGQGTVKIQVADGLMITSLGGHLPMFRAIVGRSLRGRRVYLGRQRLLKPQVAFALEDRCTKRNGRAPLLLLGWAIRSLIRIVSGVFYHDLSHP